MGDDNTDRGARRRHLRAVGGTGSPGADVPEPARPSAAAKPSRPTLFDVSDPPTDQPGPAPAAGDRPDAEPLLPADVTAAQVRQLMGESGAPADLLALAEGFGDDLDALTEWLRSIGAGVGTELIGDILDQCAELLKRGTPAVDAELWGVEFLRLLSSGTPDPAGPLAAMLEDAGDSGHPAALAFARVMAHLGPAEVRATATTVAHRLATRGAKDPAWVRSLGRPTFSAAFGYRDPMSAQESIAVGFAHGRRTHACVVLIDRRLGGGVKDVWFADDADDLRGKIRRGVLSAGMLFEDHPPWRAAEVLDVALAAPPCPADPDQMENVATYLPLLRQRVELIPRTPPD